MKNLINTLLLLFPLIAFSQNPRVFTVKANVAQTGGGTGYWQVSASNVNDPLGLYDATEISAGDSLQFNDGGIQYSLAITLVVSASGQNATFRVGNTGVTGLSGVPTSPAVISRGTPAYGFVPWTANISDADNQANQENTMRLIEGAIDSKVGPLYFPDGTPVSNGDTIPDNNSVNRALDTVLYRNDSAFAKTNLGTEFFTGLTDAPRPSNGRIWYVSKNNPACSALAVVGDPTRPFCNPWQAVDSLAEFDAVEIFPGTYTIGNVGSGASIEVSSNWAAICNLYKDNVFWYANDGVVIQNNSDWNQAIFNTNSVVTTTAGKQCFFGGLANLIKSGFGRLDLTHDLGTAAGGSLFFQFKALSASGGGFDNRTRDRVDVYALQKFDFNNQLGDFQNTKNVVIKSPIFSQTSNARPALSLEGSSDGQQIAIECDDYIMKGANLGSVFTYGGTPTGNDSLNFSFKAKRLKITSGASFTTTFKGKFFSRNSSPSTGNNKYFNFEIGEIVDLSTDTMPIFNLHGVAFTDAARVFVDIKKGYSAASLWTANVASNCTWRFSVGQWNNAGAKPVFANYNTSSTGELWVAGHYVSTSAPVLYLLNSRNTYVENARFSCGNSTAIATNTNNISIRNSVLLSGTSAPIANITATPVTVGCMGVYTNSTVIDADVTETIQPIIRNAAVK